MDSWTPLEVTLLNIIFVFLSDSGFSGVRSIGRVSETESHTFLKLIQVKQVIQVIQVIQVKQVMQVMQVIQVIAIQVGKL